jgi:RNA 3'-terminal phosphate cyclase (ATP)
VDYFKNVFLTALSFFGVKARVQILRRGYYPRGQGQVLLEVEPAPLKPGHISYESFAAARNIVSGISHCSNLPQHVAERQAASAIERLHESGYVAEILQEVSRLPSTGSGITIWTAGKGASSLGERGLPAEKVGQRAAEEMERELCSPAAVDVHLADQLIPYLALAGGSYSVREISRHTKTNIWTAGHFLEAKIEIKERYGIFEVESSLRDEQP